MCREIAIGQFPLMSPTEGLNGEIHHEKHVVWSVRGEYPNPSPMFSLQPDVPDDKADTLPSHSLMKCRD